jgi:Asp-tRNA(Asn)/Glu-tRNA(Gln) amidotransferase A subunit family amidase
VSELCDLTGTELSGKLRSREVSASDILESCLSRIDSVEDRVQAFLTPTPELARERAAELDAYLSTGAPQTGVAGIPVAL